MPGVFIFITFLFGAVIGSFLNVVVFRYSTGFGLAGRSMCLACGKTLEWFELIPLVSFFMQSGKCRTCLSKISWQYPLVEVTTGILFALIFWKFPPLTDPAIVQTLLLLVATGFLMVIAVYDTRHKVIPDVMVYLFDFIALISVIFGGAVMFHPPHMWTLLAGPILAAPFALLWLVSKGRWIGLGDAKLVLGLGWILGLVAGINALIISFWIGAVVAIAWMLLTYGTFKRQMEIPFGPFLILGFYIVLLFGLNVLDLRTLIPLF